MTVEAKNDFLQHMYATLRTRVGRVLAGRMTRQQSDEFAVYLDANDQQGALAWMQTNLSEYKDIVAEQVELLKDEIRANVEAILAAS